MRAADVIAGRVTTALDWLTDLAVAGFATWTVVYWICAAVHIGALVAVILWLLTLPLCAWVIPRGAVTVSDPEGGSSLWQWGLAGIAWLCALAAGVVLLELPGSPFNGRWALALIAAAVGVCTGVVALLRHRGGDAPRSTTPQPHRVRWYSLALVLFIAAAAAVLSLIILRPDADDIFYVNRSTYVAQHGVFPQRDTLYGDLRWPALENPPVSSFEPLLGAVSNTLHAQAPTVIYLIEPGIASVLFVLAMWRLLRMWNVRWPEVALLVALVFLVMGGVGNSSFGNLSIDRIWQGKVVLVCIGIPLMYVTLAALRMDLRPRRMLMVFAAGVMAVGLSSTGVLEAPMVAAAAGLPMLLQRRWWPLVGSVVLVLPALGVALVVHAMGGLSSGTASAVDLDAAVQLSRVAGGGVLAVIAILAMFGGWVAVPGRVARLTAATASLLMALLLAPNVLSALNAVTGAGPVLWRILDVVPAAALVGAMCVIGAQLLRGRARAAAALLPIAAIAVMVVGGEPLWASANKATLQLKPAWKIDPQALSTARAVIAAAPPGAEVAAPPDVSAALAMTTTIDHAVDPRNFYLPDLAGEPGFDRDARVVLDAFAMDQAAPEAQVVQALRSLHVDVMCLPLGDSGGDRVLDDAGYKLWLTTTGDECFRPQS